MFQVFAVRGSDFGADKKHTAVVTSSGREGAKAKARKYLGGNPDKYSVEPITDPGDAFIFFDLALPLNT